MKFVLLATCASTPGLLLGLQLLLRYDGTTLKQILGGMLIASTMWRLYLIRKNNQKELSSTNSVKTIEPSLPATAAVGEKENPDTAQFNAITIKSRDVNEVEMELITADDQVKAEKKASADLDPTIVEKEKEDDVGVLNGGISGKTLFLTILAYFMSGFCTGLFTVGGPPLMLWVFAVEDKLNRNHFRAGGAVYLIFNRGVTAVTFLFEMPELLDEWYVHVILCCLTLSAYIIGNPLSLRLSQKDYGLWILSFLFCSAVIMVTADQDYQSYVLFTLVILLFITGVYIAMRKYKQKK